jgi:hypothetical protein
MDYDKAMQWADALESGKYPQGKFALNRGGKFCCLGVLSDVAADEGIVTRKEMANGRTAYNREEFVLTHTVREWAGMQGGYDGDVRVEAINRTLMGLNDKGTSFPEIATVIREHWESM